jgi:hypothetical protein
MLSNLTREKNRGGVCWVGVGEMLSNLPPKTACRLHTKIREIEFLP